MKKKLISLALAGVMVLGLTACGGNSGKTGGNESKGGSAAVSEKTPEKGKETAQGGEAEKPSYERASVRVAYMPNMGSGGTLITAKEMGYFEDYGLDVTLTQFQAGPPEIAAMASGDIDISQIGHGAHSLCIEGQAKIFAIDCLSVSDAVMVNTEKGINNIYDLKGKTVAVATGTSSDLILTLALQEAGLTKDDFNLVEMDAQGMVTAMVSGQIDACATWTPSSTTIKQQMGDKVKTIASNYDYRDKVTFPSSFITTDKFNKENHDVLVRFAAALLKAQEYRKPHVEDVCRWLAKELEGDPELMLATKDSGEWLTATEIAQGLKDGTIKKYYEAQQKIFIDSGRIPAKVDTNKYILYDVMDEAMALYQKTK